MMNWIKSEPGVLTLEGTPVTIVLKPASRLPFQIWVGKFYVRGWLLLARAKADAEQLYADVIDIGFPDS
jgi:hypothetical protein